MNLKISAFVLGLMIYCPSLFSQEKTGSKLYLKIYGNYGFLTPGSYTSPSTNSGVGSTTTFTIQKKGLGSGPRFGGGIGVILNDFINIGIDADYLSGSKLTSSSNYVYPSGDTYNYSTEIDQKVLSIIPNITFRAVATPQYYIYTRLGIAIGLPTIQVKTNNFQHYSSGGNINDDSTRVTSKYTFKVGLGYQAAIGIQFNLTENLRGFVEVVANSLVLYPTKLQDASNVQVHYVNGTMTANYPQSIYIYQYEKTGTYTYVAPPPPVNNTTTYTNVAPQFGMSVNSINIGIGIAYRF
jgi:hypothetical protein